MSANDGWYYASGDTQVGPTPEEKIDALIAEGTITGDTLVWKPGMGVWTRAADTALAARLRNRTPPPIPSRTPPAAGGATTFASPASPTSARGGAAPAMGFQEAIRYCLENYVTFSGRGSRSQYWYFVLFVILAGAAASLVDKLIGYPETGPIAGLVSLALFLPNLAVTSRRFHDAGWSFWWWLLVIVPVVGWFFVLYVAVSRPEPGPNRFDR